MADTMNYVANVVVARPGREDAFDGAACGVSVGLHRRRSVDVSAPKKFSVDGTPSADSSAVEDDADLSPAFDEPLMLTVGAPFLRAMLERMMADGASCRVDVNGGVDQRPPWPMMCRDARDVEVAFEALQQVAVPSYRGDPYPVLVWVVPDDREFSANDLIASFLDAKQSRRLWHGIVNEGVISISIAPTYCDLSVDCARLADASEYAKHGLQAAALEAVWFYCGLSLASGRRSGRRRGVAKRGVDLPTHRFCSAKATAGDFQPACTI